MLIACSTLHIGGAEGIAACIAEHIDRSRFDVTVCYLKEDGIVGASMRAKGIDLVPVPGHMPGRQDRLTSVKLLRLIRERRIQVVHTHDVHGLIDGTICRRLMPRLRHVHTFHYGNFPRRDPSSARAERICWRSPDALVAVGHAQADSIRAYYEIPASRLHVIWNGIADPAPTTSCTARHRTAEDPLPVILSISTLIQQKGLPDLLRAAKILKDDGLLFRLVIAGHGALRTSLEELARELVIADRVEFLGWVPDAARRILPACDIFVQSSLWEAMSIVVLEAMAAARPMVVTRVGENEHVLQHGASGLVVPPGNPTFLAAALERLLRNPSEAADLGAAARRRYLAQFTFAPMLSAYQLLYDELARRVAQVTT